MKFLIISMLLAVSHAGVLPIAGQVEQEVIPGVANEHIVQGPSTKTRLLGPDGSQVNSDAAGGTIVPEGVAVAPVVEVAQPLLAVHQPVVAVAKTIVEPIVTPLQAIVQPTVVLAKALEEGQYVPDNTEKLYDDGSYKPSPLEEADDGSYKGEQ